MNVGQLLLPDPEVIVRTTPCRKCGEPKVVGQHCLPCKRAYKNARFAADPEPYKAALRKWRALHPGRARQQQRKSQEKNREQRLRRGRELRKENPNLKYAEHLRHNFNLTPDERLAIYEAQGGSCAICKQPLELRAKHTHTDHNRRTGNVRGILCNNCNVLLGYAGEKPEVLLAAIAYLSDNLETRMNRETT